LEKQSRDFMAEWSCNCLGFEVVISIGHAPERVTWVFSLKKFVLKFNG
jgi:hypothetical protein